MAASEIDLDVFLFRVFWNTAALSSAAAQFDQRNICEGGVFPNHVLLSGCYGDRFSFSVNSWRPKVWCCKRCVPAEAGSAPSSHCKRTKANDFVLAHKFALKSYKSKWHGKDSQRIVKEILCMHAYFLPVYGHGKHMAISSGHWIRGVVRPGQVTSPVHSRDI